MRSQRVIELQERDIAFLRGLFECRVMTTDHAASLYFDSRRESAKKRLQKLKSAGLIAERSRKQFEPSVLFLSRLGLATLKQQGILELYPAFDIATLTRRAHVSEMTLRHEIAVLDLKVAVHVAARSHENLSIIEFTTWPRLNQFEAAGVVIKPDAFVRIGDRQPDGTVEEHSFYVEVDRSTEPLNSLCERARAYAAHCKSAHLTGRDDTPFMKYQKRPFRVLYVLQSRQHRDNIARRLLATTPPILALVWLATFPEMKRDPFGAIWMRPIDYKMDAQASTPLLKKTNGQAAVSREIHDRFRGDWQIKAALESRLRFTRRGNVSTVPPANLSVGSPARALPTGHIAGEKSASIAIEQTSPPPYRRPA